MSFALSAVVVNQDQTLPALTVHWCFRESLRKGKLRMDLDLEIELEKGCEKRHFDQNMNIHSPRFETRACHYELKGQGMFQKTKSKEKF